MGTGVVFPGSCHVYAFKVDVPRGAEPKESQVIFMTILPPWSCSVIIFSCQGILQFKA